MALTKLKLNPDKTSLLHLADTVKNLGVCGWILTFLTHNMLRKLVKPSFLQMHDFRRIRQYLTQEVTVLARNVLVTSRLDYCNSLFRGLLYFNQIKLQNIQNTLACIVTNQGCLSITTVCSKPQHWFINC